MLFGLICSYSIALEPITKKLIWGFEALESAFRFYSASPPGERPWVQRDVRFASRVFVYFGFVTWNYLLFGGSLFSCHEGTSDKAVVCVYSVISVKRSGILTWIGGVYGLQRGGGIARKECTQPRKNMKSTRRVRLLVRSLASLTHSLPSSFKRGFCLQNERVDFMYRVMPIKVPIGILRIILIFK